MAEGGTVRSPTGINWTPDMIVRGLRQVILLERDAEHEAIIAEALNEHVEEHQRTAMNAKLRAKDLRERMERDGVWTPPRSGRADD